MAIEYVVLEYDDETGVQKISIGVKQAPTTHPNLGQDIVKLKDREPGQGTEAALGIGGLMNS